MWGDGRWKWWTWSTSKRWNTGERGWLASAAKRPFRVWIPDFCLQQDKHVLWPQRHVTRASSRQRGRSPGPRPLPRFLHPRKACNQATVNSLLRQQSGYAGGMQVIYVQRKKSWLPWLLLWWWWLGERGKETRAPRTSSTDDHRSFNAWTQDIHKTTKP